VAGPSVEQPADEQRVTFHPAVELGDVGPQLGVERLGDGGEVASECDHRLNCVTEAGDLALEGADPPLEVA
jgi:hypothetical protein